MSNTDKFTKVSYGNNNKGSRGRGRNNNRSGRERGGERDGRGSTERDGKNGKEIGSTEVVVERWRKK